MLQGRRQIELLQGIYQALHMTVAAELRFVLVPLGVSDKRVEERRGELQQRHAYNSCSVTAGLCRVTMFVDGRHQLKMAAGGTTPVQKQQVATCRERRVRTLGAAQSGLRPSQV